MLYSALHKADSGYMKKQALALFLITVLCSFSFAQREKGLTGRFVPRDGKTLVFAGQNNNDSDEFVKIMKKIPAGFMFYTALSDLDGLENEADFGAGKTSGDYLVRKYPGAALQIGLYLVGSLEGIVDGSFDNNIKKLAEWIKSVKSPVFLRIGYEFDYPENGYEPEKYKAAFRYIVEKMDGFNVANAAYVWHSYASLNPRGIEAWYPGDDYVDWCAISYFANPQWIPMLKFARKHSKPLMIAECAPMLGSDLKEENKPVWYNKLFRFAQTYDIKALSYINCNWDAQPQFGGRGWGNGKINASRETEKLFKDGMSDERFVFYDKPGLCADAGLCAKALIIFCHPDNKNGFNAAIMKVFTEKLKSKGIEYKVRDLYKMNFNPVLSKKDRINIGKNIFSKKARKERALIKEADIVVFIYPVWWSAAPAMLKGYIDRCFSPGFASDARDNNMRYRIKYKDAVVINTVDMPEKTFAETGVAEAFGLIYDGMTFETAGFKIKEHKYFFSVSGQDGKLLESYLKEAEKIADSLK